MNKSWIITEKYVGWGTANVIAKTKEEAMKKYEDGDYLDYEHDLDNAQDYEFFSIEESHEAVLSPALQKESDQ